VSKPLAVSKRSEYCPTWTREVSSATLAGAPSEAKVPQAAALCSVSSWAWPGVPSRFAAPIASAAVTSLSFRGVTEPPQCADRTTVTVERRQAPTPASTKS
jgi:hypothetical protein